MQRYFSKELKNNIFYINNDDMYHIIKVMRMKPNDNIEVVYNNNVYICALNSNMQIEKKEIIQKNINNAIKRILIIPLLKEQKMDLILQKSTELGVDEIIPLNMERSIIRLDKEKINKKIERWSKILKEASEQSKRTDIPNITNVKNIDDLKNLDGIKMICSTSEKEYSFKNFLTDNRNYDKINIVIGPEGGISNNEEEKLQKYGFSKVSLGERILRVETVPICVLSILNYEYME